MATIEALATKVRGVPGALSGTRRGGWRENFLAYSYLLPASLILLLFHFLPVGYAFYISLHEWKIRKVGFLGLENYQQVLHDPKFWSSLKVTVFYVLGTVPFTMALSLIIASLLFQKIRFRSVFRTVYFLPYITSQVAAAAVWLWIFNPRHGPLNQLLEAVGLTPQAWMNEPGGLFQLIGGAFGIAVPAWAKGPSLALVAIVIVTVWHYLGFDVVVFLAGLGNIPPDLYDAAKVDGANRWQLFRHVTLPLLSPTTFFVLIISVIGSFQAFNMIYVMTAGSGATVGGPLDTTTTTTVFMFKEFYNNFKFGYASAIAFILFGIILSLTVIQRRYLERHVHYMN